MPKLNQLQKAALEKEGVTLYYGDNYIELEFYSPAGEDYLTTIFTDSDESFSEQLKSTYEEFDIDAHAVQCYNMNGAPQDLGVLLNDAKEIEEKLYKLYQVILDTETWDGTCPYCHSSNIDSVDGNYYNDGTSNLKYICRDCNEDFIVNYNENEEVTEITDRHNVTIVKYKEED